MPRFDSDNPYRTRPVADKIRLFVYGTLKQGGYLFEGSEFKYTLVQRKSARLYGYQLYDLGAYPGVKKSPDQTDYVSGEIQIHDGHPIANPNFTVLDIADAIEHCDKNDLDGSMYERKLVRPMIKTNGEWQPSETDYWIYLWRWNVRGARKLKIWRNDSDG